MKRFIGYGSAVAVAGAGFAGGSVALSPAAGATVYGGCGVGCDVFLTNSNGLTGYGGSWGNNGQGGTCNVALYSGPNVVVGGAVAQGPKKACNVFSDGETGPKGSGTPGSVYTVAMWQNGNVIGSVDGSFPY